MPQPVKSILELVREYTREIIMFGGFALAVYVYHDHNVFIYRTSAHQEQTAVILAKMDEKLDELKDYHRREEEKKNK